jgi:hypothetical protein
LDENRQKTGGNSMMSNLAKAFTKQEPKKPVELKDLEKLFKEVSGEIKEM